MKKITLLAALFMAVISHGQQWLTNAPLNGNFEGGTATVDYNNFTSPGNSGSIDNWLFKTVTSGVATTAEVAVEDGDNAFHVLIGTASGKPNIRLEMQPAAPTISPVPSDVVPAPSGFVYSITFKIKFSAAITDNFQIQSKFRQTDNTTVNHTGWDSAVGGFTASGANTNGKADINATGLAVDTWHTVQVNYSFADVTLVKERQTLWFNMGAIPAGTHFYIDDIEEWITSNGVLSTEDITKEDSNVFIYPNPASNILNYKAEGVKNIEIYNLLGQKVIAEKAIGSINISSFAKGLYVLKLMGENGTVSTKKFIKQ